MNLWKIMNLVAWGLSLLLLTVMLKDLFRVEKARFNQRNEHKENIKENSTAEDGTILIKDKNEGI